LARPSTSQPVATKQVLDLAQIFLQVFQFLCRRSGFSHGLCSYAGFAARRMSSTRCRRARAGCGDSNSTRIIAQEKFPENPPRASFQ